MPHRPRPRLVRREGRVGGGRVGLDAAGAELLVAPAGPGVSVDGRVSGSQRVTRVVVVLVCL